MKDTRHVTRLVILLIALTLSLPNPTSAQQSGPFPDGTTVFVDVDNTTGVEKGSQKHPFDTIQEGINAAVSGDVVGVAPGTYAENVTLKDGVQVLGTGADVTIIDGGGSGAVVTGSWLGPGTALEGFTLQDGAASGINGAGIEIRFASLVIRNNVIHNNQGWGIAIGGASTPQIEGNIISNNSDGIILWASQPILAGNVIDGNTGYGVETFNTRVFTMVNNVVAGNGRDGLKLLFPVGSGDAHVINNTIVANSGAGVSSNRSPVLALLNNILADNGEYGVFHQFYYDWGEPNSDYNDVWGNCEGNYGGLAQAGANDISADPVFADAVAGDYHLQLSSPAIDAGDNTAVPGYVTTDLDGNPRIVNGFVDMGAYEAQEAEQEVLIDIKPGSYPNSIILSSEGVVPVAVLTTEDFDASTIDPVTVDFTGAAPLQWAWEDPDRDGDVDILLRFNTQELNLDENSTEATLNGMTYDGLVIWGVDTVNIVP